MFLCYILLPLLYRYIMSFCVHTYFLAACAGILLEPVERFCGTDKPSETLIGSQFASIRFYADHLSHGRGIKVTYYIGHAEGTSQFLTFFCIVRTLNIFTILAKMCYYFVRFYSHLFFNSFTLIVTSRFWWCCVYAHV